MKHKRFLDSQLRGIQCQYRDLVRRGLQVLDLNYFSMDKCLWFVDEVTGFWLERKQLLNYCWDRITAGADCFILSAAIGLGVEEDGHYRFKGVGDYQLLHDPFLKLEMLLRAPSNMVNSELIESRFKSVMKDTLVILNDHLYDFYFINLSILGVASESEKKEVLQKGYINFLNQLFEEKSDDVESISNKYPSYTALEKRLSPEMLNALLFSDIADLDLSLGGRVDKFIGHQGALAKPYSDLNESEKFLMALFSLYAQAQDTILCCLASGVIPFFRSEVPVRYFYLFMRGYEGDEVVTEFIKKSISGYFLGSGIDKIGVDSLEYDIFKQYLNKEKPYRKLVKALKLNPKIIYDPRHILKLIDPIIGKIAVDLKLT